jgi:carbamoyltransferase
MGMELDVLVVGNCVLEKAAQSGNLAEDYTQKYELD